MNKQMFKALLGHTSSVSSNFCRVPSEDSTAARILKEEHAKSSFCGRSTYPDRISNLKKDWKDPPVFTGSHLPFIPPALD